MAKAVLGRSPCSGSIRAIVVVGHCGEGRGLDAGWEKVTARLYTWDEEELRTSSWSARGARSRLGLQC
jgi:hypothetical protein